ncbi:CDP-glycerol glycerophosphotransferase family protein [Bacillus tuaregi]|uniref:CDP-glycerol glycerophosphotransferase family protein n=1 Tax=Bacillus tuaregi TaxID=1816695 RepID=UPI0008F807D6|nr:CDP-glycerol glycerophosphotransferase family protein [Bacillus tuaregi]
MNTYLDHYWALYREFIEAFKHLTFKKIPICLLTNFYQHIDQELKVKLEAEHFPLPELKQDTIQPYFEKYLPKTQTINKPTTNGKILVNYDYTRIPESSYQAWFDPNKTIILSRSRNSHVYGIPNETIAKYEEPTEEISEQLVEEAKLVFAQFKDHIAFGNDFFQQTFLKRIPLIVKTINTCFNLFNQHTISAIIVGTTEDVVSRSLAIVGSLHGIKSICLQHGILMGEEAFMPIFTSAAAVYGEYEKNWYLQRGLAPERILEIGHPKYDEIFTGPYLHRTSSKESINPDQTTLLVITGPNLDPDRFTKLIKSLADSRRYQLIIKPHPWEIAKKRCDLYYKLEKEYKSIKVQASREVNLYELIGSVDGVVATLSTVVVESILLNKPVFLFDFLKSNRVYDYFNGLGGYVQTNSDELYRMVHQYYSSPKQKLDYAKVRQRYVDSLYLDGTSGQRLLEECGKIEGDS